MKKRLRKKKYLKEFQELGFTIRADAPSLKEDDDKQTRFIDELIDFVEARDLCVGGIVGSKTDVYCARFGRGSATEEDRKAVFEFLAIQPEYQNIIVGELSDAWYGTDEDE